MTAVADFLRHLLVEETWAGGRVAGWLGLLLVVGALVTLAVLVWSAVRRRERRRRVVRPDRSGVRYTPGRWPEDGEL